MRMSAFASYGEPDVDPRYTHHRDPMIRRGNDRVRVDKHPDDLRVAKGNKIHEEGLVCRQPL